MMWQGRSVPTSQYPNRLVEFIGEDFYSKNRRAGGRQLNGERNAVKALTHASSERQIGVVSAQAWSLPGSIPAARYLPRVGKRCAFTVSVCTTSYLWRLQID